MTHRTQHVDAKLEVLAALDKIEAALKYNNYRPGKLTDEERAELAHERSIKHQPPRRHHYD